MSELFGIVVYSKYRNIRGGYVKLETFQNRPVFHNREDSIFCYSLNNFWVIGPRVGSNRFFFKSDSESLTPYDTTWSQYKINVKPVFKPPNDDDTCFHDSEFPCDMKSIGDIDHVKDVVWKRGSALQCSTKPVLFSGISPDDIMQGNVGDCWLLSALSSLAEFPKHIRETTFKNHECLSEDGKYVLQFYDMGQQKWIEVTIDESIPVFKTKEWWSLDVPCFAQTHENELYILLIEKAFAKLAGSYEKINGGYPALAWIAMTGCEDIEYFNKNKNNVFRRYTVNVDHIRKTPFDFRDFRLRGERETYEFDTFFEYIFECDAKNFMMTASINGSIVEKKRHDGLIERHAYSLLRVYKKNGVRLIQLRNPWGTEESNLKWNRRETWAKYPEISKDIGFNERDDGEFWISAENFFRIFDGVQICKKQMILAHPPTS